MLSYPQILRDFTEIMSIPGFERNALGEIKALLSEQFDEIYCDSVRNIILVKHSAKENSPKIMLDAHFDEVGMLVSGVTDEGFLRVMPDGGIDRALLPASDAWVYTAGGRIYGVFAAESPHLSKGGEKKTPEWKELLLDIGCRSREAAEALVEIGDAVGYNSAVEELLNRRIIGHGFDDKSCAAGLVCAVADIPADELKYDVYITLSSAEEVGGHGAACAAYSIQPELAVITDVNFALTPGVSGDEGGKMGGGPMISLSAVTDRNLTREIISAAEANSIAVSKTVEPTSTGTNASCVYCINEGIPVAVVGIPLAGMHSYNESLSLDDAEAFIKLIKSIIR